MDKVEKIFTEKFLNNSWKGSESKSGPGSSVLVNKRLINELEDFCIENNFKTILDCGCGDFNWMKEFNFGIINTYLGVDIVEDLINENIIKYQNSKIKFLKLNLIDEKLYGRFDVVLCKDVLFHLSYEDAISVINNIKNSNSKILISTTFTGYENKDIKTGNWRPINLENEPFNLGSPMFLWENIENKDTGFTNKGIGIWKIND